MKGIELMPKNAGINDGNQPQSVWQSGVGSAPLVKLSQLWLTRKCACSLRNSKAVSNKKAEQRLKVEARLVSHESEGTSLAVGMQQTHNPNADGAE